ncbi:MAG: hypothetical protein ACXW4B_11325 [Micavibrio sp.]
MSEKINLTPLVVIGKTLLCFFIFAVVLFIMGPSAAFILGATIFFSYRFFLDSKIYANLLLDKNSENFTGDFKKDFGGVIYKSFSKPAYKIYFLQAAPTVIIYLAAIILLSRFQSDWFWYFSEKNELFVSVMDVLFPTTKNHFDALKGTDILWGETLRQIYSVTFAWLIGAFVIFMTRIKTYSEIIAKALSLHKTIFNKYFRVPAFVTLLLLVAVPFSFVLINAPASGGSEDYVFRRFGAYDVRVNNNYFFNLFISLLMPFFAWWICVLLIGQCKMYVREFKMSNS